MGTFSGAVFLAAIDSHSLLPLASNKDMSGWRVEARGQSSYIVERLETRISGSRVFVFVHFQVFGSEEERKKQQDDANWNQAVPLVDTPQGSGAGRASLGDRQR